MATEPLILALDQGTTSSRAILFDFAGRIVNSAQLEFRQIYPQPGYVEHDPYDILETQKQAAENVLTAILPQAARFAPVLRVIDCGRDGQPIRLFADTRKQRACCFCTGCSG